jgi:uncharacterized protein (TIGR02391 family)
MNVQTNISSGLWEVIASPYQAGNYSHAVLEAIHRLTTVLRERSGADGDGAPLVGQALGGDAPKLRVNGLQSESERNVQKGVEQMLRGMYLAIRNPRSHEKFKDSQQDADAIIHFIDYILRILDQSKEAFTIEGFLKSLSDPEFVESKRYADLLVAEVPVNRRGDALAALFSIRNTIEVRKLRYLVSTLVSLLNDAQLAQYVATISDELRSATEDVAIRTALQMTTPELWQRIAETARLRIENKLIREIKKGEILSSGKTTGALGTWGSSFIRHFALRAEAADALISKLEDLDGDDRHYAARFFLARLPEILTEESEIRRATRAISSAIESGDANMREMIILNVRQFPSIWQSQLVEALRNLTDAANPAVVFDDGTPFLAAPTAPEVTDEDIPF